MSMYWVDYIEKRFFFIRKIDNYLLESEYVAGYASRYFRNLI